MAGQKDRNNASMPEGYSEDAREFVESVMNSQKATRVDIPFKSGRKRHLSVPSEIPLDPTKRACIDVRAKRTLNRPSDGPSPVSFADFPNISGVDSVDSSKSSKSSESSLVETVDDSERQVSVVESAIQKLSADMHMMFSALDERLGKLESGIEQRIANKVAQLLDKRVNSEMSKVRKDVDARLETFKESLKDEVTADIAEINTKLQNLSTAQTYAAAASGPTPPQPDRSLNVVIRGLPSTNNERVIEKVNVLIKDGLRVNDVSCVSAERKQAYNDSKPGVVIASFTCHDDKRKVLSSKRELKNSRQYNTVYIDHDLSVPDRIMNNNFRTILSALRDQNLTVRGTRVVHVGRGNDSERYRDTSRNDNRNYTRASDRGNNRDSTRDSTRDRSQGDDWQTVQNNRGHGTYGNRRGRYGNSNRGQPQHHRR